MTCDESQLAPSRLAGIPKAGFARLAIVVVLLASLGQLLPGLAAAQKPEQPGKSQKPGTTTTTTITTAVVPLTVEIWDDLHFGKIISTQLKGDVTINPETGIKTVTGGVFNAGGIHGPAEFSVTGERNATIVITLPTGVTLARRGGGNPVIIRRFASFPPDTETASLGPSGKKTIFVGARIDVQPNERDGEYRALFMIFVDYAQ